MLRAEGTPPPKPEANYVIAQDDVLKIKVFQEDDLESVLRVSKDGTITFPLIGVVHVAGKSTHDAALLVRDGLAKDYLVNPQVTLTVEEYAKRRFTVLGQVQKPGSYDMPDRDSISLLEAIGMAGGYTRIADPGKILLKRQDEGRDQVFKLNAKKLAGTDSPGNFKIQAGDVITVSESIF